MNEQYFKMICEETNVKETSIKIADTEKGEIHLTYVLEDNHFYWTLDGDFIYSKKLEAITNKVIDKLLCTTK